MQNFIKWLVRAIAHYLAQRWAAAQALARGATPDQAKVIGLVAGAAAALLVGSVIS